METRLWKCRHANITHAGTKIVSELTSNHSGNFNKNIQNFHFDTHTT